MNVISQAIENKVVVNKYVWAAIWAFNLVIVFDLWANNGKLTIDFLYFITGG